ncbi:hypothetical protein [Burkholderia phage FLC9]|nr:hypothetical protein [Burkholderia phage FLC9]
MKRRNLSPQGVAIVFLILANLWQLWKYLKG